MQTVTLICTGKMREKFYISAFEEYRKRLGAFCRFQCVELPEERLHDDPSEGEIRRALEKEAAAAEKAIPKNAFVVALCVEGKTMSSPQFAQMFLDREQSGKPDVCFLIGSSFGMDERLKKQADLRMSMSPMTFPHHLARVLLAEQIYRAYQINRGSRYHK